MVETDKVPTAAKPYNVFIWMRHEYNTVHVLRALEGLGLLASLVAKLSYHVFS